MASFYLVRSVIGERHYAGNDPSDACVSIRIDSGGNRLSQRLLDISNILGGYRGRTLSA